jgi:hypothetical protein
MREDFVTSVLDVLHLGVPLHYELFAKPLIISLFGRADYPNIEEALDLSGYKETKKIIVEEHEMKVSRHLHGVYRIVGKLMTVAFVPHEGGVKYYLQKHARTLDGSYLVHREGKGPHVVHETVNRLVEMGCESVLAWRLLAVAITFAYSMTPSLVDQVVLSFQIISGLRAELRSAVTTAFAVPVDKRLMGSKIELFKLKQQTGVDKRFSIESNLFKGAKSAIWGKVDQRTTIENLGQFNTSFLSLDNVETYMELLDLLIKEAKSSDLNLGAKQKDRSQFNARTVAILGALEGNEVKVSLLPNHVRTQYFYQDDEDTKSLCTPFSNLILFATTTGLDNENLKPVQSIQNGKDTPNNWIALRAAFEFDMHSGKFRYDTAAFRLANDLVNESIAKFIDDTTRRFSEFFDASPDKVNVSQLTALCDEMAKQTGASSAWLVREMVSRYISKGAQVVSSGREQHDGYGIMEMTKTESRKENRANSKKILEFDCKVNIEGLVCSIYAADVEGDIVVILGDVGREIECVPMLMFKDGKLPQDHATAKDWLRQGRCTRIELVTMEKFLGTFCFLSSRSSAVVGKSFV